MIHDVCQPLIEHLDRPVTCVKSSGIGHSLYARRASCDNIEPGGVRVRRPVSKRVTIVECDEKFHAALFAIEHELINEVENRIVVGTDVRFNITNSNTV